MKTISIIGCGWLGFPLALRLKEKGYLVKGSVTSAEKATRLQNAGLDAVVLTLTPEPEGDLAALLDTDALVISVPPRAGAQGDAFHPRQIELLTEAIRQTGRSPYVIYVSSTSVYPEKNQTAFEEEVVGPEESAAPALVEAERRVLALGNASVVRCGGLMGYDRIPGKYVAGRQHITTAGVPVNYIHRDDAAGLLLALLESPRLGETFNAVAPEHPTREAVYRKSCADFGFALPTFAEPPEPVPFKVVNGEKAVRALGYTYIYPNPLHFLYSF